MLFTAGCSGAGSAGGGSDDSGGGTTITADGQPVLAVLHSFDRAGQLLAAGVLDPLTLVSHRFPLTSYATALEQFRRGEGRKILIEP